MSVKLNKNERNGVKKGFKHSSPDFYCSLGIVLVFLQNYIFATTLSNSVYRTTLMFFDVLDSFLMFFNLKTFISMI